MTIFKDKCYHWFLCFTQPLCCFYLCWYGAMFTRKQPKSWPCWPSLWRMCTVFLRSPNSLMSPTTHESNCTRKVHT